MGRKPKANPSRLRVSVYVDEGFWKLLKKAMDHEGFKTRAEFVRTALKEKVNRVLRFLKEDHEASRTVSAIIPMFLIEFWRQLQTIAASSPILQMFLLICSVVGFLALGWLLYGFVRPVSYTHLTLPTN